MLVYLKPESSIPELSSDTIFGSIIYSFSQLYPEELDDIMDLFTSDPPFLVSSSFPYIENDERVRFYPKIITEPEKRYDPQKFKKYKKHPTSRRRSSSHGHQGKSGRRILLGQSMITGSTGAYSLTVNWT